jgi:hypothetical protein
MNIILAKACENCGGQIAIKITTNKPTEEEIKEVKLSLGGMFCIMHEIFENVILDESIVESKVNYKR